MTTAPADTWFHATVHEDPENDTLEVRLDRANSSDAIDAALALRYHLSSCAGCEVTATDKTHLHDVRPFKALTFTPAQDARAALERFGYVVDEVAA